MKKQTLFLFTKNDEQVFNDELKTLSPNIVFVDNVGSRASYLEKFNISECESNMIGILNKDIYPQGVAGGVYLIFMNRSNSLDPTSILSRENFLSSGEISIIIDKDTIEARQMKLFVKDVWNVLRKISTKKLHVISLETGKTVNEKPFNIIAGHDAVKWCRENQERFFKFRSVQVYLKPSD